MLNKYLGCTCTLNVSWTENNNNHEVLVLAKSRTFVLATMRKIKCLYFEHMIGNDPQRISNAGV